MTTPPTQGQGLPQGPPEPVSATPVPPGAGPGAGVPEGAATSTGAVPQVPAGVPAYGAGQQLPPGAGVPGGQVPPGAPGVPTPAGAVPQVPGQVPPGASYGVGAAQPMAQQPFSAPPAYYNPGQVSAGVPAYGAGPGQQAVPGQVLPGAPSAPVPGVPGAGAPLAPQAVGVPVYTPVPAQQPAYYNPPGAPGYPPAVPPSQQPRTWASVTALVLLLVSLVPNVLDLFTAMTYSDRFTPNRSLAGVMVGMLVSTGLVSAVIGVVLAALRRPTGIVLVSALVMVGMYPNFLGFDQASLYYHLMGLPSAIVGLIILVLRVTAGILLLLAGPRGADRCPATVLLSRGAVGAMGLVVLQQVVTLGMTQITLSGLPDEYFATMDFWFSSYLLAPSMFGPNWTRASLYQDIFSVGVAALVLMTVLVLAALVLMVMRRSWVLAGALAALAAGVLLGFNTYVTVARYSASTRSIVVTADVFTVPPLLALVVLGFVLTGLISPRARAWAQARK